MTIFTGGTILTVDADFSEAEAIAIQGDKILAVGSLAEVTKAAGSGAKTVDLQGKVMLPGFVEAHTHPISGGLLASFGEYVGVASFGSTEEVIEHLRRLAADTPKGDWIVGINYDPSLQVGPEELTLDDLDRVSTEHPVFVLNASGHLGYANRMAFAAAGIDENVVAPPGAEYVRDASGKLNGVMKNNTAWLPVLFANPAAQAAKPSEALVSLTQRFSRVGLTTLTDLSFGGVTSGPGDMEVVKAAYATGKMAARLRAYPLTNYDDAWDKVNLIDTPGMGDGLFRVCGYKLIADGSNQGFTGLQREPYLNSTDRGLSYMSVEELAKRGTRWGQKGWLLSIHGNGDAGIDNVLDACEKIRDAGVDLAKVRTRIEHCSILHDDQIARMKELGVQASFLIGHVHYWGVAMRDRVFGEEKAKLLDRARSCEKAGVGFTLHSDYFVTEPNPLHMIEMAVTRKTWKEPDYVLAPDERISVETAIRAMTINAAWQMGSEHEIGSLEAGKFADFVLLEKDPRKVDPDTIKEIAVLETWLGGTPVHKA
ncbi:amidohydrolase [Roseibium aestuarii]|uniref:Amidohydrolase n=1 Tax=Roseibium aestuarii TaxID=2600299 RepID=A0ABW4K1K0_9HYPH|nr:amidohydrolase [Roseibium aestuarii]